MRFSIIISICLVNAGSRFDKRKACEIKRHNFEILGQKAAWPLSSHPMIPYSCNFVELGQNFTHHRPDSDEEENSRNSLDPPPTPSPENLWKFNCSLKLNLSFSGRGSEPLCFLHTWIFRQFSYLKSFSHWLHWIVMMKKENCVSSIVGL